MRTNGSGGRTRTDIFTVNGRALYQIELPLNETKTSGPGWIRTSIVALMRRGTYVSRTVHALGHRGGIRTRMFSLRRRARNPLRYAMKLAAHCVDQTLHSRWTSGLDDDVPLDDVEPRTWLTHTDSNRDSPLQRRMSYRLNDGPTTWTRRRDSNPRETGLEDRRNLRSATSRNWVGAGFRTLISRFTVWRPAS